VPSLSAERAVAILLLSIEEKLAAEP